MPVSPFRPACLCLGLWAAMAVAAAPSARSQTGARVADLVYIDFLAGDERGIPVSDLRKDEVTFRMDGKPRQIRSLQFVPFGDAPLGDRIARKPLPPPFGTNVLAESGRLIMIVVEHESIRPGKERPAMQGLERMLSRLSASDRVGLATMPHGRVELEPTTDHDAVADVLRRLKGQAPQAQGEVSQASIDSEKACNSRLTLSTLAGLLEGLAVVEGPKSIVFVSSGVMPPRRDALMTQAPGRCEIRSVYFDSVADAASLARAHFYVVQPDDLNADAARQAFDNPTASRFSSADEEFAGLQHLTGVTGGEIFRLNGPADAVFAHIARESSGYYMVGFEPLLEERDGMSHRVQITVSRPRTSVRARPHLSLGRGPSSITPQQMLRDPRIYHDLPLRAVAYPARMLEDARVKIVGLAEPLDPGVPVTAMSMAVLDPKGRIESQWTATADELRGSMGGPYVLSALVAPAGNYRLRVGALDANGRRGSVDYEFDAAFENAGTLKLSSLALGVGTVEAFTPRLLFAGEPSATAFLEIYGDPAKAMAVSVRLEIASDRDAPAIVSAPATTQPSADGDRRMAAGTLPLGALEPGDYIVRAIVTSDGKPLGRVYRTLRKGTQ